MLVGKYVDIKDGNELQRALKLAKGCYQANILLGYEAISGATLRGRSRSWSGRYKESSSNLVNRLRAAGIKIHEERRDHGRRVLVIG